MAKGGGGKEALAVVAIGLIKRLSEPEVQDAIARQAVALADMAKKWNDERRRRPKPIDDAEHEDDDSPSSGGLGAHFGQRKLERRVERLESSIDRVADGRPDLVEALTGARENLAAIRVALDVADGLPLVKRKQAHFRLDEELDKLERLVFDASMPSTD